MIKINLATRKQATLAKAGMSMPNLGSKINFKFDLKELSGLSLTKPIIYLVLSGGLWYGWSWYQEQELARVDVDLQKVDNEIKTLRAELDKTKGYEAIKKALDQDELTLRTKIGVINKLVTGRQDSPKTLVGLATGIPKDVWLDSFTTDETTMKMHGTSLDFENVSDFMKNLGESAFFSDIRLVESKDITLTDSLHAVDFSLAARKK